MSTPDGAPRQVDPAGRYVLESRIATGGMGEVWRGRDTVLDRPVAVKLLKPEYADDASFRTRFGTEARHAAALHHPHVAAVFDFGESPATDGSGTPRPYLVMELVDGQPLSALLRPGQAMAPAAVTALLAQAADAIGAAHAAGIVHRDVKPANLLVTRGRQVKITDFGIARATEGMALTQTGQVMGTPQYLSPEQAQGGAATPASDVYSLGVVAFECLAGRRPFEGSTQVATALAHVREPVPDLPGDVPDDLALVVRTCLAKDPADRFPDGAAVAAALRDPATAATSILAAGGGDDDRTRVAPAPWVAGAAGVGAAAGLAGGRAAAEPPTAVQPATGVVRPAGPATPAEGTPASGGSGAGSRRTGAVLGVLLLVAVVVVAALLLSRLTGGDDDPEVTPTTSAPATQDSPRESPTRDTSVLVDPDDFLGRPVDDVEAELRDLGLEVDTAEVDNPGGEEFGAVTAVDPSGELEEGALVTVSYFGPEPEPAPVPEEEPQEDEEEPQEQEQPEEPAEEATEPPAPPTTPASPAPSSSAVSGSGTSNRPSGSGPPAGGPAGGSQAGGGR